MAWMQSSHCRAISLTDLQKNELEAIVRRHKSPQALVLRAKIILAACDGLSMSATARVLKCTRETVTLWRRHWVNRSDELTVTERLKDAPRPGQKPKFTPEQVCQIIALSCDKPEEHGYILSHWSENSLAMAAVEKGIVSSISQRQVGRFLKSGRHQTR